MRVIRTRTMTYIDDKHKNNANELLRTRTMTNDVAKRKNNANEAAKQENNGK